MRSTVEGVRAARPGSGGPAHAALETGVILPRSPSTAVRAVPLPLRGRI